MKANSLYREPTTARPRGALALAILLLGCFAAGAQTPTTAPAEPKGPIRADVAPPPPVADRERYTVIRAGRAITIHGEDIRDAVIVIADGKIEKIGRRLEYPLNARLIDARDRVVMPGLINVQTRHGLPGYRRSGVQANWNAADEFFPGGDPLRDLRAAGFTLVALAPTGSGLPGRAAVVRTGGPVDKQVVLAPAYIRVSSDKAAFRGALERAKKEIEKVDKAREEFEKKQEEARRAQPSAGDPPATQPAPTTQPTTQPAAEFKPPAIDPALQPLVDLIQKKEGVRALIEIDDASAFVHMLEVLKEYDVAHDFIARFLFETDFEYVLDRFAEHKPRIALQARIMQRAGSAERLHLARMLAEAGCTVALMPLNDSRAEHERTLARLSELVAAGWTREAALKGVTLHAAELLGVGERFGTLAEGKAADLIFLDADPLAPGARVRAVMIAGEIVHEAGEEGAR